MSSRGPISNYRGVNLDKEFHVPVSNSLADNCNCYFEALKKLNATDIRLFIGPRGAKPQLSVATRAAIKAYAQSGKMLDAALTYAAYGFPVFPLTIRKTPDGNEIPGTGSFKKATCDPIQIRAWWTGHEYLIGLPMGRVSGVWTLDVDTSEDHADGVSGWNEITAQHDPIVTREHRSATGGPHLIFNWTEEQPLHCSAGALPSGIEVKGEGGYIVAPPSRRKKRSYTVHTDIDPIDAPAWLIDKILQGRSPQTSYSSDPVAADFDELAEALSFVPNDDLGWDEWTAMGLRIFAATGGQGFDLFDAWSQKSEPSMNRIRRSSGGRQFKARRRTAPVLKSFSRWRESTAGCRGCGKRLRHMTSSFAPPTTHAVQCAHSLATSYTTSPTRTRTRLPRTGSSL
jgi:hypothetical protein